MKLSINIKGKLELYTDLYDICFECSQKEHCPLIGAIKSEVVVPRYETIEIVRCGLFKSYRTTPNTPHNICKKYLKNITDEILKLKIFNFRKNFLTKTKLNQNTGGRV